MCKHNKAIESMFSSALGTQIYGNILDTLESEGMFSFIDRGVLVGFSGGSDSVLLLSFLYEYKRRTGKNFSLIAAHVNHMIRGEEADRDERFSVDFASGLGIEVRTVSVDVPAMSKKLGTGIEETARNARYSIFADLIKSRNDIYAIAVAHNATDNTETVLMNMLRGSGLSGICGIKPIRENVIRPLIKISKSDILSLLDGHGIPYVTDSTNLSVDYTRNYVRREILPLFTHLISEPEASVTRLTDNLRCDLDYLNSQAREFIKEKCQAKIYVKDLREIHPAILARVFSILAYESCGEYPEEKHISALRGLLKMDNFRYSLPGSCDFVCERGCCFFVSKTIKNTLKGQIFSLHKGENKIYGTNLTVYVGKCDISFPNVYNFSIQAYVSSDIIDDGLFLRFKKDGDAYKYHGITHKLKKVFNDRNIPSSERDLIPIICDANGILVIPGMSERDGAKSDISTDNTPITFMYGIPDNNEVEVFTALLRK